MKRKMRTKKRAIHLALLLPMVALLLTACAPKSPEEKVAQLRTYYKARLIGFIVEAEPVLEEPAEEPMEGTEGEPGEGEAMESAETTVPIRQNVTLDILLQHDSPEKLPGITLDIEMVDSNKERKNAWKLWVDTSELPKATGIQFVHVLENLDYEEGDGFSVEVTSPVPPEERAQYREFSEAAEN